MTSSNIITSVQDVKLPFAVKIGYSVGGFAKSLLVAATSVFLLYFYTDVCGIDSKIASTIILIAKVWDIINDPIMGGITDKTVSKEGKCRFWLKYFSVPTGIIFALSFFMPNFAMPGKIAWAAVTYILQGTFSTVLLIPLNTLMGRITSNQQQRVHLNQFMGLFGMLGGMFVSGNTLRIVEIAGGGDRYKGFAIAGAIFGAMYILLHLIVFWSTKGYEPLEHLRTESELANLECEIKLENQLNFSQKCAALIKNPMWIATIVMFLFFNLSTSLEGSAMAFYFQYNHGSNMQNLYTLSATISVIFSIIPIVTLNWFTKYLGVAKTTLLGGIMVFVGYFLRFILADGTALIMCIGWAVGIVGQGLVSTTILLHIFSSKEYGLRKTGVNNEGILMAGYSFSYKIGMAIGGALIGYIMPAAYVPQAESQVTVVTDFFFNCSVLYPAILMVPSIAMCVLLMRYEASLKVEDKLEGAE